MAKYIKKVKSKNGKRRYIYDKKDLTTVAIKPTYTHATGPTAPDGNVVGGGLNHYATHVTFNGKGEAVKVSGLTARRKSSIYDPNVKSKGVKRRGKGLGTGPVGENVHGGKHDAFRSLTYQKQKANAKKAKLKVRLKREYDKYEKEKAYASRPIGQKVKDAFKSTYNKTGVKQRKMLKTVEANAKAGKYLNGVGKMKVAYQQSQYDKTFLGKAEKKFGKGSAKIKKKLGTGTTRIRKKNK